MANHAKSKEIQVQKPAQSLQAFQRKLQVPDGHSKGLKVLLIASGSAAVLALGAFGIHAAPVNGSRVGFQNGRNDRRKISVAEIDTQTGQRSAGGKSGPHLTTLIETLGGKKSRRLTWDAECYVWYDARGTHLAADIIPDTWKVDGQ